jgi:hypothetical protein
VFLLITAVMVNWFIQMHRRSLRSWRDIVARLSPQCSAGYGAIESGQAEAIGGIWVKLPRVALHDAGVLMEMVEYAERNSITVDPVRLQLVRSTALQLRIAATGAMIRSMSLSQVTAH